MNRHARRSARTRECLAPYTFDGGTGIHAPAECDGTCWAHAAELPGALFVSLAAYLAEVSGSGSQEAAEGAALRMMALMAREDLARLRAAALAAVLARVRDLAGSAWAQLRVVLEVLGLVAPRRAGGLAGAGVAVVACCPHTGPPALAAALGAPVISP